MAFGDLHEERLPTDQVLHHHAGAPDVAPLLNQKAGEFVGPLDRFIIISYLGRNRSRGRDMLGPLHGFIGLSSLHTWSEKPEARAQVWYHFTGPG